jgi:hypothetical protein
LLLSDFFKGGHDVTETINIFGWLFNFKFNLLDHVSEFFHSVFGSLVKILSESIFP